MKNKNNLVAIYPTHTQAEDAVKLLKDGGIDVKNISVVGKGFHAEEHPIGYYNTGDRVKFWGKEGAFWGGLWGMLFGSAFFWVPGVGPLAVAGPLTATLVGGVEGAVITGGLTALGASLYSIGIPKDSVMKYETVIKEEKLLLIVNGTTKELEAAKEILTPTTREINLHLDK